MLLEDEQKVIKLLSMYGALHEEQIRLFLHNKSVWVKDRILRKLKRESYIYENGGYLALDLRSKPRLKNISAIWVLLKFIDSINSMDHYPAAYPSQVFFLKGDSCYEIIVINDGEQNLSRLLQPQDDMKYIIVLPGIEMANGLILPDTQCLFATVDYTGGDIPSVQFYSEESRYE